MSCNYDGTGAGHDELQLSLGSGHHGQQITFMSRPAESAPQIPRDSLSPESGQDFLAGLLGKELDLYGATEKYALTKGDVDILRRFQNRTVYTIGTARSVQVYRTEIVRMVCSVCVAFGTVVTTRDRRC